MDNPFNFYSDDDARIQEHLASGKAVCYLLNKELSPKGIAGAVRMGYVFVNLYKGEERMIIAHGCYRQKVKRFDLPNQNIKCPNTKVLMNGIYAENLFKQYLLNPLCLVLNDNLTDIQVDTLKLALETFEITINGSLNTAIACTYYNPHYATEGKVIAQAYL